MLRIAFGFRLGMNLQSRRLRVVCSVISESVDTGTVGIAVDFGIGPLTEWFSFRAFLVYVVAQESFSTL
jgi:hypothetical protein